MRVFVLELAEFVLFHLVRWVRRTFQNGGEKSSVSSPKLLRELDFQCFRHDFTSGGVSYALAVQSRARVADLLNTILHLLASNSREC